MTRTGQWNPKCQILLAGFEIFVLMPTRDSNCNQSLFTRHSRNAQFGCGTAGKFGYHFAKYKIPIQKVDTMSLNLIGNACALQNRLNNGNREQVLITCKVGNRRACTNVF